MADSTPRGFTIEATFRDGLPSGVLFEHSSRPSVPHEIDTPLNHESIGNEFGSAVKAPVPRTDLALAHAVLMLAGDGGTMPGSRLEPFFNAARKVVAYWREQDELLAKDPEAFAKRYMLEHSE